MDRPYVYLDYAASAPLRPEAVAARDAYEALPCSVANPNSLHTLGRQAAGHLERARRTLAVALGSGFRPFEVSFCGGGTEANNLAVMGLAEGARTKDGRRTSVVIGSVEHDSVLDLAAPLKARGFSVSFAPATARGCIDLDALEGLCGPDTALVCLMAANNETGVIQPVDRAARIAHGAGALVHVDAVQAFGRIPLDVPFADSVSLAGHKIGAPVGTAALALRSRAPYRPQSFGGGQEGGRRPGTQDVAGACALAACAELCVNNVVQVRPVVADRARAVYQRLCGPGSPVRPTVDGSVGDDRLPGIVSLLVDGMESETLILALDAAGFGVSAGSACSSGSLDPSHVLTAMGIPRDAALGSLRVSFDERVDPADLDRFCDALLAVATDGARR